MRNGAKTAANAERKSAPETWYNTLNHLWYFQNMALFLRANDCCWDDCAECELIAR